ncbi:hypothetical protein GCM10009837_00100 [Streptomyces durmitorensis]
MISPTKMSPFEYMAAPRASPGAGGPGYSVLGAFHDYCLAVLGDFSRRQGCPAPRPASMASVPSQSNRPEGDDPLNRPFVQTLRAYRGPEWRGAEVRRCRLTPEVFTGGDGASRSRTATVNRRERFPHDTPPAFPRDKPYRTGDSTQRTATTEEPCPKRP